MVINSRWIASVTALAALVMVLSDGCSDGCNVPRTADEIYRVRGQVQNGVGVTPLEGVAVTAYDTLDLNGVPKRNVQFETTTDSSGGYWIRIDFWMHGYLSFEKDGYHPRTFDVSGWTLQTGDYEYTLDILLFPRRNIAR
ncbi:MAG: carboxypeptidase regulatory-like domain-containing protein [Candidatus Eisenbacteria sp.]|nr:carboxypeptidase regulatory-like domain-containing protein [Candidatus Eisenbacteria bacterium]